ncbi:MAG: M4 family metallopeptidase [Flavobacteriales bacterium]|nr:M4 family metallopeptidase [Flavobacteriales bacterium]
MIKNTVLLITILFGGNLLAQQSQFSDFIESNKDKNFITYKSNNTITVEDLVSLYKVDLGLSPMDKLKVLRKENDNLGVTHYRYQQYHKGVEVYGAQYMVHEKNQQLISSNGKLVKGISKANSTSIKPNKAILNAISFVGAEKYMWESAGAEQLLKQIKNNAFASYYPQAELVFFDKYFTQVGSNYKLAYKVEVYAEKPLSKQDVFVDAQTGEIIHAYNKLHTTEVTGIASTKYAGTQSIQVDSLSATSFRLREYSRGGGIETYNMLQGTNYALAVDFTDTDNIWNNVNAQQDEAATDAHWAAEMTYDYFLNEHGRNSYDNAGAILLSYVHYDANYSNAFWDGVRMTYGDGDGSTYTALTSLDVGGHEITHGVTEYTADLVYQNESGALNESFSDVFAAAIEFYADPANADWFIGEDFDVAGNGFRSMSDPNASGDPDTYLGNNWEFTAIDNGGVHTNSGVQNYWFYLLSDGGSGTNDNGDSYNVTGLGINIAAAIAYRNLSVYLTQSSEYIDARNGSIQSAEDLYGACSNAVIQTSKAWAAVGVGFAIEDNDLAILSIESPTTGCGLTNTENVTIKIRNNGCLVDLTAGITIPVAFQVDGGVVINETITLGSNFNASDTISYTFTATADLSTTGMHTVSSWVKYGLDVQPLNDSTINLQVENKLQQNVDVALVNILSPVSGCHLTTTENVEVAIQFLGCDSLVAGTNIDLAFQLDGGTIVNETLTLPTTIYGEDTVYYTFTGTADVSINGTHNLDAWTAFTIDNINGNDTMQGYNIKHPVPLFDNQLVTFENNTMVLDTTILTSNIESDASVSNASAATGSYALRMTGGDPLASGITPDLDSNGFWSNNMEFAATAKFCVDATGWSVATLNFDLRQTNSMVYNLQFGQAVPAASSMRLVVDGTQIGGTYMPLTETNDPFTPYQINLNAYAGTQFELVFETRMGFSEAADPLSILGSEGDNAYIDNIIFTQIPVGVNENNLIEEFVVYPNPNNGIFLVQLVSNKNQEIKLEVYNVLGSVVVAKNKAIVKGLNQIDVDINEQANGIYFVKLISGETTSVVRVVKN